MANDKSGGGGKVYPVGLYYVGAGEGGPDDPNRGAYAGPEGMERISVKQEHPAIIDTIKTDHEFSKIENQKEDRNSESYWDKRKRFTLAFAAGLRKFIQVHPELLRCGTKKSQQLMGSGISDCSPPLINFNPIINITPIDAVESVPNPKRTRRPQRNAAVVASMKESGDDDDNDDTDYSPHARGSRGALSHRGRRGRRSRSNSSPRKRLRLNSQPSPDEQHDSSPTDDVPFDMPVTVMIKEEPPDKEEDDNDG